MTLNLTNAGLNVLLRALAGDRIIFTKAQIGNGEAQAPATAEALSNPLLELPIQAIEVSATNATLQTKFNNNTVEAGFRHTETGIWVQNQDDDTQEVLYAYGTQPEATADYISASGDSILETQMDFLVFIGEAVNISAIISESLVYASAADLKAHVDDTDNPHKVTKKHVGLEHVPNVATNDQTPTYTAPGTLAALTSGEKLGTAMGKLARAVTELISHLKNTKNPHKVTAEEIGAAEDSHEHTATDITKGTLRVNRGGTGKGTWAANRIPYLSASSVFSQLPFPAQSNSVLHQDISGAPYWVAASESGTYTGTGKYGEGNANTITFSGGVPDLVVIAAVTQKSTVLAFLAPKVGLGYSFSDTDGSGSAAYRLNVSTNGNAVSWYALQKPADQCNLYLQQYRYYGMF